MQLELFCAEETVRGFEQRINAHAERERIARLLAAPRCGRETRQRETQRTLLAARIEAILRRPALIWCAVMPRRWNPCTALS